MGDRMTTMEEDIRDLRKKEISRARENNDREEDHAEEKRLLKISVDKVPGDVDAKIAEFLKHQKDVLSRVLEHFHSTTKLQMEAVVEALRQEGENLFAKDRESKEEAFHKYGAKQGGQLLRELFAPNKFFVAALRPVTEPFTPLKYTLGDKVKVFGDAAWVAGPLFVPGVEDCKFLLHIDAAEEGTELCGGDKAGFTRALVVSGELSLAAALHAVEAQILVCKKCGKREVDAECDECNYKGVMPGSPTFSPKSPPQALILKYPPPLSIADLFNFKPDDNDDKDRNEDDDRDKDRDRDRSKSKNSRNSRNSKNKR